jgi:hypothetical protein
MAFSAAFFLRNCAVALFGLLMLSACTVAVDEGPEPGPQFCTREYNPVCARRGGERRTFSNSCLADRAGYDVIRQGECRSDGGGGGNDGPRACTREYNPVCARRGGERRTFSNSCVADQAGYDVIRQGECRSDGGGGGNDEPRFCTKEYRPVCARRGGAYQTFGNACEADAAGWNVVQNGPC